MTYFNKKEDVYHIELTPHGRYLLSIGKLNFKSYAFFDDDVLYDGDCAGVVEGQNNIKIRIQDETPYMKPNGNYYSVETNYQMMESDAAFINRENERTETKFESFYYMKDSIGTNEYTNDKSTNFKVDFLNNEIVTFSETLTPTAGGGQVSHIPQVNFEIEYKTFRDNVSNDQSSGRLDNVNFSKIFDDGSYVDVLEEDAIIQIQELNSESLSENFKLEVFIEKPRTSDTTSPISGLKSYRPLIFRNKIHKIVDGMLLSDKEIEEQQLDIDAQTIDPSYVEYYFDLNVDKEIASEEICSLIGQIKERNFYISDDFQCEDISDADGLDIYESNIGPDDLEEC